MIAGADWFQGRWLTALEHTPGETSLREVSDFGEVLGWNELEVLVVDIPIGLPERGSRSCDTLARRAIRPRGSSVFPAPIRPVLDAPTHEEACRIFESLEGKRCSIQAFGIYSTIAGVDRYMSPTIQERVREGHPELSFAHMNGDVGLAYAKGKPDGQQARMDLLEPHFPELRGHIASLGPRRAIIDLLDAFSMLWTARRVRSGESISIPEQPEYDSRGLRMEMVGYPGDELDKCTCAGTVGVVEI
jgi:predicted RNase H-like nuclease